MLKPPEHGASFAARSFVVVCLLALAVPRDGRCEPEIVSMGVGRITWTNESTQGIVTVQWAPSLEGAWSESWGALRDQPVTGLVMSASVPTFFRVVQELVTDAFVAVSNVQNAPDATGYGRVNYGFSIARCEVINADYVTFLNALDPYGSNALGLYNPAMGSDPRGGITNRPSSPSGAKYALKPHMGSKPVVYVGFWDALRYCNWLHNGQGSGSTETGAYVLGSVTPGNQAVSRGLTARFFLPNEDEWYKAAYYDAARSGYWLYPTGTSSAPALAQADSNGYITNDSANVANYNFGAAWNGQVGNVTAVGSGGPGSESAYGAADMAGNVYEWNETVVATNYRCIRGGCWFSDESTMRSTFRGQFLPADEFNSVGFRVACP